MSRTTRAFLVVLTVIAVMLPVIAIAGDRFTDVPDTDPFHTDIGWLADAGVTLGCNPPTNDEFCPEDPVKRKQMAAFMRRFAAYLGAEDGIVSEADTAATAGDAGTLDGLDSTDFLLAGTIVTSHHPTEWMDNSGTTNAPTYFTNRIVLSESAQLGLTAPNEIGGVLYGLTSVEFCYAAAGAAIISATQLQAHVDVDWSTITFDGTDRTSTSLECYTVENPSAQHADSWNVFLSVSGGDGGANVVDIYQVQATWEPTTEVAVPTAVPAGGDGGDGS